ncbi:GNAT family N-acetyltransferase [Mycobacterium shinjukuense]|uniref:N-acetyltransferase GCN5 n=1 Tax=Mycobacterium shinjukuense TaxID=398694 RepID=A0A7I7MRP6_9MYCO|nr:GNAT family N-acetyltransferase [Mycobacterium shinjukuense]BBX74253.1 N-acetyltransferase GCN5 [Mycobacterium shinjukuense]
MSTPALGPVELLDPDRHDTARFSSGVEVLDHWLRRVAPVAAAAGTAATWVLCRGRRVVGFYALAMGSIERIRVPSRLGRGQPDPVPVLVLARLALDRQEQGTGLGGDLLLDALIRSVAGARQYGARALVVDAIDDRAAEFYGHHGFLPLEGRRLYRRISDIAQALGV